MLRVVALLGVLSGCSLYFGTPVDTRKDHDAGERVDARSTDARAISDAGTGPVDGAVTPDARVGSDAGLHDAGSVDAGAVDAGAVDAGPRDAAPIDAGAMDAGVPTDAGAMDAGVPIDAGGDPNDSSCIESVQAGPWSGCLHKTAGAAQCWGLAYGDVPSNVAGIASVVEVAPGYVHACARKSDGTVWCWGANGYGQLGDGTNTDASAPVQVVSVSGGITVPLTNAIAIDAGENFACALRSDHTVWCWGRNADGQLGAGNNMDRNTALPVIGITDALQIATGAWHACALRASGVSCWGYNRYGGLGDGTTIGHNQPVPVAIANVVEVTAGYKHSCARKSDGTLWCWGRNADGQLGNGTNADTTSPVQVLAATGNAITTGANVSAGAYHSCATLTDGTARCWGYNAYGQLGNGAASSENMAVEVNSLSTALTITTGERHTCARRSDKSIWCWGQNGYGQLGNASPLTSYVPARTLTACP
jgi:alpha-tubulin suppressor-like RCC1 family protein